METFPIVFAGDAQTLLERPKFSPLAPRWPSPIPTKCMKLIVPYPPGGATDVIGRVMAQRLTRRWASRW